MRCCLQGFVTVIALALVAAALVFGLLGTVGPDVARLVAGFGPTATVVPAPPVSTPRAMGSIPTLATGEVQLARLTDADLTQALRAALAGRPEAPTLEDARVRASGGRLTVTGVARSLIVPVDIEIGGRVGVRGGRPQIVVERAEGAGVPLPQAVREQLESQINAVTLLPTRTEVEITRVETGEGVVTVFGRRR